MSHEQAEKVFITSRQALRDWLEAHHSQADGVWLVTYKKADAQRYVPYDAVVEECLCVGWVDSLPRRYDAERTMLYIAPRRAGSNWSKANRERIARLESAGLLREAGQRKVEQAKADGSWSALETVEALHLPDDLAAALMENPVAEGFFEAFPPSVKRAILEWIQNAKRAETRQQRIATTVSMAAQNRRANQWRQPKG